MVHPLDFLSLYSLLYLEYTIFIKRYPYSTDERIRRNAHVRGEVAIANSRGGDDDDEDDDDDDDDASAGTRNPSS